MKDRRTLHVTISRYPDIWVDRSGEHKEEGTCAQLGSTAALEFDFSPGTKVDKQASQSALQEGFGWYRRP